MSVQCNVGFECRGGVCVSNSQSALSTSIQREVVQPISQVYVDSTSHTSRLLQNSTAVYIGGELSKQRLLLQFPKQNWNSNQIIKAYLVFERAIGAQPSIGDVRLRIERIVEPWSERGNLRTTWENPPASEPFESNTYIPAQGPALIRVDITRYAKDLTQRFGYAWGLRIEGESQSYGVAIATGSDGKQRGPYMEVFMQ